MKKRMIAAIASACAPFVVFAARTATPPEPASLAIVNESVADVTETAEATDTIKITESVADESETAAPIETFADSEEVTDTVYWTPTGSVWHASTDCASLSRSKSILSGSSSDAVADGISRACARCSDSSESTAESESTETTAVSIPDSATVYWVTSGKVWHVSAECSSLSRSKSIDSGSIDDAKSRGLERVCSRCG